jgi:hypothetical protein
LSLGASGSVLAIGGAGRTVALGRRRSG